MTRPFTFSLRCLTGVLLAGVISATLLADDAPSPAAVEPAATRPGPAVGGKGQENRAKIDAFFSGPVRTLSFEVGPQEYERLKRNPRSYVEVTMKEGDTVYPHVAMKLKGGQGSFRPIDDKPGLTLKFDQFDGSMRYHGMKRFQLNNSAQDPTFLNELIAGEIARKAGVPAARCTHALVRLNGRDLGLYVLKEAYTKDFLAEFYADASGDLYDGGYGDISETTEKTRGDVSDTTGLRALIAACGEDDDAKRWEKLSAILDIERFINYLALENIVVHWDSYSFNRNNYRFYQDPATGRFSFILDGMDQTLAFPGHQLIQPRYVGMVSHAIMRTPRAKPMYLARVERVLNEVLKPVDWVARVEVVGGRMRDALALDHPEQAREFEKSIRIARERVAARILGVERQLAAIRETGPSRR